jgi:malate dehydrogenase (oxaloacetate-decarboxylating)(NADP+)
MIHKARQSPVKVVYPEGDEEKIIRAAHSVYLEGIAKPVLLGNRETIKKTIQELDYDEDIFEIRDPQTCSKADEYALQLYQRRQRKGVTLAEAKNLIRKRVYYGPMMLAAGEAQALISGITTYYPQTIKPALQCIGVKDGIKVVSGMYIVVTKNDVYFFSDCSVNVDPTAEQLAHIAISSADTVKEFDIVPKVAMLSFSNFGSAVYPQTVKVKEAVEIVHKLRPDIIIDGEMQADTAVTPHMLENQYPFSNIKGSANVLVFPNLESANIAYKLMANLGQSTVIGPILIGMNKPIHVLQRGATVDEIINMTAIAVVEANHKNK